MINNRYDLLRRSLDLLAYELEAMVSSCCAMAIDGTPIPGTCDPELIPLIDDYMTLVRDIRDEIGPLPTQAEPWLEDLLNGGWSLTEES
jgi:hypothetical protein